MSGFAATFLIPDKLHSGLDDCGAILPRHFGAARRDEPGTHEHDTSGEAAPVDSVFSGEGGVHGFRAQALRACPGMTARFSCEAEVKP